MENIKKILLFLFVLALLSSCIDNAKTSKYQTKRNNVLNIRDKIKEIKIENPLIGQHVRMFTINDYLIIADSRSVDKMIYVFDKNSFNYITSIGDRGQGPYEITLMGHITPDEEKRMFYVTDHGKLLIYSYALDSVLTNPMYKPMVKMKMNNVQFPESYTYINDTLSIGVTVIPTSISTFDQAASRWNMNNGEIVNMKYSNPKATPKRLHVAVDVEDSIYVECYYNYDLMTICSLDGDLKYNIYGPEWDQQTLGNIFYFGEAIIYHNQIIAS